MPGRRKNSAQKQPCHMQTVLSWVIVLVKGISTSPKSKHRWWWYQSNLWHRVTLRVSLSRYHQNGSAHCRTSAVSCWGRERRKSWQGLQNEAKWHKTRWTTNFWTHSTMSEQELNENSVLSRVSISTGVIPFPSMDSSLLCQTLSTLEESSLSPGKLTFFWTWYVGVDRYLLSCYVVFGIDG